MIAELYRTHFADRPLREKIVLLLTASVFLPLAVTAPMVVACAVFLFASPAGRRELFGVLSPALVLLPVLWAELLIVPLVYRNYAGFGCAVYFVLVTLIAVFIRRGADARLAGLVCDVSCLMSLLDAAAAGVEILLRPENRVEGLTYNANFYAFLIEFVLIFACYRFLTGRRRGLYAAVAAVNLAALFLTDCRSAWAALFLGLLVLFALLGKGKHVTGLAVSAAAFCAAVSLFPALLPRSHDFVRTYNIRLTVWAGAFRDFLAHPVFGRGFLAYLQVSHDLVTPHAHDIGLDVLECTGVFGAALVAAVFVPAVAECLRALKSGPESRGAAALVFACLTATLVHGITDMPIMGIHTALLFFLVLALRPGKRLGERPRRGTAD